MSFLNVSNISSIRGKDFELRQVSFTQEKFQNIAIAGETGSGKSTLLRIIAGLIQPATGSVFLEGERVPGPQDKLVPGHPAIGYLSQHYELRNAYRVEKILSYANLLTEGEAAELYQICGISHLLKRRTEQLSGGEKQRIALARLLITSPKLLLLDEPYSNLDLIHTAILKAVIKDIGSRLQITFLMVSHSPVDSLSWADEILIVKDGAILQQGSPKDIYRRPINEYAAGLFGSYNLLADTDSGIKLFLRPEDFKIGQYGMEAVVTDVLFFGSYYEVTAMLGGDSVTIRTQEVRFEKGDTIFLSGAKDAGIYLP